MRSSRSHFGDVVATSLTLLAALGGLAIAGWRPGESAGFWSDLPSYFLPKYDYAARVIASGRLPLWNPFEFTGIPFLATFQPGVFYPPLRVAYLFVGGATAYALYFAIHVALAAGFTFGLVRSLGAGRWPSVVASAWVVQPLWMVRVYDHPIYFATVCWIPLLFLMLRRCIETPNARNAALLGATAALQALGGYPPLVLVTAYMMILGLPFLYWDARRAPTHSAWASVITLSSAVVIAALLAAAQILPTLVLAGATSRGDEAAQMQAVVARATSDPKELRHLLAYPAPTLVASIAGSWREFGPFVLGLATVGPWLAVARRASGLWLLVIATLATLLPADVIFSLPLYEMVRFGQEWRLVAPCLVFIAAGLGLAALEHRGAWSQQRSAVTAIAILTITTAWNLHGVRPEWLAPPAQQGRPIPKPILDDCGVASGQARVFWPGGQMRGTLMSARVPSVGGYEQSLRPTRLTTLTDALRLGNGMPGREWSQGIAAHPDLAARMGLRCAVTTARSLSLESAGFERIAGTRPPTLVYRNPAALARARLVTEARWLASPDEVLQLLLTGDVDPTDTVLLEGPPEADFDACASGESGAVSLVRNDPEEIVLDVRSPCPAHLVLSDTYLPGWTAHLDEREVPIRIADYAFRSVRVPAGHHRIVFRYRPESVRIGFALSSVGLLIFGALVLGPWATRLRDAREVAADAAPRKGR